MFDRLKADLATQGYDLKSMPFVLQLDADGVTHAVTLDALRKTLGVRSKSPSQCRPERLAAARDGPPLASWLLLASHRDRTFRTLTKLADVQP